MRPILFALPALAVVSAASFAPTPAQARDYPWCAQYSEISGGGRNCGFETLEQCRATLSGMSGFCEPNPRYTPGRSPHRRHKRYYRD